VIVEDIFSNVAPERTLIGFIVRHGALKVEEGKADDEKVWDGWGPYRLSEEGRRQAEKAGQWLSFEQLGRIVTSDLPRAVETAEIILAACNVACPYIATDPNLRSWAIGDFTGKKKTEERREEFFQYVQNPALPIPGGESHDQCEERVVVIDQYLAVPYKGLPTVVICHNSMIKARLGISHPGDVVEPGGVIAVYLNPKGEFEYEIVMGKSPELVGEFVPEKK